MRVFIHKIPRKSEVPGVIGWIYLLVIDGVKCASGYDRSATLDLLDDA